MKAWPRTELGSLTLDDRGDLREERIAQILDEKADQVGTTPDELASKRVRLIAKLIDRGQDLLAGWEGNDVRATYYVRRCGGRYTGERCDVRERW